MSPADLDWQALEAATADELESLATLAIGRLLALGSRPYRDGDDREYATVRRIVMTYGEKRNIAPPYAPWHPGTQRTEPVKP